MEEPDEEFVQMDTGASIMLVPIIKKKSKKGPTQSTLIKFINQIGKSTLQSFDFPIITKIVDKKIIEYVALKELYFLEGISKNTALKRLKTIDFIYPRQTITKEEYTKRSKGGIKFPLRKSGSALNLISIQDAILYLSKARTSEEKDVTIRQLVIELTARADKDKKEREKLSSDWWQVMLFIDKVIEQKCHNWEEYCDLWKNNRIEWKLAHWAKYCFEKSLGKKLLPFKQTVLDHKTRPYSKVYPCVCSSGDIIAKRFHKKGVNE